MKGDILWCVPIRYWENIDPIKCHDVGEDLSKCDDGSTMRLVYHEGYKHNVWVDTAKLFPTCVAAINEAVRKIDEKEKKDAEDFEAFWERLQKKI